MYTKTREVEKGKAKSNLQQRKSRTEDASDYVDSEGESVKENSGAAQMILIAGPYRSGTNDDAGLIRKNVELMESYALPIFRAGHIPVLGEWFART